MRTIFVHTLKRMQGAIYGWGLGLGSLAILLIAMYDSIFKLQSEYSKMIESFPKEMFAFFGDIGNFVNPADFFHLEFYSYMPIIIAMYFVLACAKLIAGSEENGTLDLYLAHPVQRTQFFMGRVLAQVAALVGICLIIWVCFVISLPLAKELSVKPFELLLPVISLFVVTLVYGALALLISLFANSRSYAATIGSIFVFVSFFITSFAKLNDNLEIVSKFSPLNYYQGGMAMDGMNWEWIIGLFVVSLILIGAALWQFLRKDIRLS